MKIWWDVGQQIEIQGMWPKGGGGRIEDFQNSGGFPKGGLKNSGELDPGWSYVYILHLQLPSPIATMPNCTTSSLFLQHRIIHEKGSKNDKKSILSMFPS